MTHSTGRAKRILQAIAALIFWAAVWYFAASYVNQELILPSPVSVVKTLGTLCLSAEFWVSAGASLLRIFSGFIIGLIAGTLLAAATEASPVMNTLLSPAIRLVRATPVASFIILALLWIGRSNVPVFISALMVMPVVWGGVSSAVRAVDRDLLEMSRAYRFGSFSRLRLIYVPSVYPSWRSAAVTSIGLAWKSGIAAEVLCLPKTAIGAELYYSKIYLETPYLFAWTAVVVMLSFILEKLFISLTAKRRSSR